MEDEAELLERAAAGLEPARNTAEPSPLRRYIREHYDALLALKAARRLSWPQLATVLSKRGLTKSNGGPLDGNVVAVMAAQVRWERDPASRRKRPKRKTPAPPRPAAREAPPPAPVAAASETPAPPPNDLARTRAALAGRRAPLAEAPPVALGNGGRQPQQGGEQDG